ncbi:MAG: ABC transporter permease [Pirellulales bacterium]
MSTATTTPETVPAWPVVFTLAQRELVRFFRQRNRVFGALGQPIIFWLLFSAGLGSTKFGDSNRLDYAHFFPGTIVMILLFTAIFATISIIEDRKEGFLQGVLVAPVPRWSMVLGKVLGGATIAMLQGLIFLALGWLTIKQIQPTPIGLAASIALMFVISIALTSLGFVLAWRMDSTQGFHAVMSVFLLPMWLLSGAFFPMNVGGWLGWIVRLNPLTYGVAGLRHYLQYPEGVTGDAAAGLPGLTLSWMISLLFAAGLFAASCWIVGTRSRGDLL